MLTLLRKHSPDGTTRTRRHTSDIHVANYSIYRPLNDERLSWPSWLTYSGRLAHISGHPSTAGRAWDRKVRRSKTNVLTTEPCNHVVRSSRFKCVATQSTCRAEWPPQIFEHGRRSRALFPSDPVDEVRKRT